MFRRRYRHLYSALVTLSAVVSCVGPDNITLNLESLKIANYHPVHIIKDIRLNEVADERCGKNEVDEDTALVPLCPLPDIDTPLQFMEKDEYPFCSCAPGHYDDKPLGPITLLVNDQDLQRDSDQSLYATVMVDIDKVPQGLNTPSDIDNSSKVAYRGMYRILVGAGDTTYKDEVSTLNLGRTATSRRYIPYLHRFTFSNPNFRVDGVDLCNDAYPAQSLSEGYHTLTILVTDRKWALPHLDDDIPKDDWDQYRHEGVPDISNGATWDRVDYVFYCAFGGEVCDGQCKPE